MIFIPEKYIIENTPVISTLINPKIKILYDIILIDEGRQKSIIILFIKCDYFVNQIKRLSFKSFFGLRSILWPFVVSLHLLIQYSQFIILPHVVSVGIIIMSLFSRYTF